MSKPGRRISSLEAAGVKLTSSSASSSTTTRRKVIPPPISTKKVSRTPLTPTSSPIVTSKGYAKTQVQKKSNDTPPVTPLTKQSRSVAGSDSPLTTVRSGSRASNRISILPSRASASSSTSITLSQQNSANTSNTQHLPTSAHLLVIDELKDKNAIIQKDLIQKEQALIEKEAIVCELTEKLKQLQNEIKLEANKMQSHQTTGSEMKKTLIIDDDDTSFQERNTTEKEQELLEQLELLRTQSSEMQQTFEKERSYHNKLINDIEKRNHENMERMKEKYESDTLIYNTNLFDKDREIEKLKKDIDDMRNDIGDMHQSHQTRLTTLTNQLNTQHNQNIEKLRCEYEERFSRESRNYEDGFKYKLEFENSVKELELMQSKFNELQRVSLKERESLQQESKTAIDVLRNAYNEEVELLKRNRIDAEAITKSEIDQYKFKLQMSNEKLQQVEDDLRKERSVQHEVTLLKSKIEELKEAHDVEKADLQSKLEKGYSNQLKAEIEKLTATKNDEIEAFKAEFENGFQAMLIDIKKPNELQLQRSERECPASIDNVNTLEDVALKHDHAKDSVIEALQVKHLEPENQFAYDQSKSEKLVTKNDVLNTALLNDAEFETSISELKAKYNLIIKNIEEEHGNIIQDLINDHAAVKLAAGCESTNIENMSRAEKELYEKKLKCMQENELMLRNKLIEANGQSEERLALLTQAKKDADRVRITIEQERSKDLALIDILKDEITSLTDLLERSNTKYSQSMIELKGVLMKALSAENIMQLENEIESLSNAGCLDIQSLKHLLVEVLGIKSKKLEMEEDRAKNGFNDKATQAKLQIIIDQHQKELNVLQNQFQSLLDMKDKELSDLYYKMKSTEGSILTDDTCSTSEQDLKMQLNVLEDNIKSKSLELRWLESDNEQNETKIKDQGILIHNLQLSNDKLESSYAKLKNENEHMLRLIHQLQDEIRHL